jgi:hypothetical protein
MPALLNATSTLANRLSAVAKRTSTYSASVTSQRTKAPPTSTATPGPTSVVEVADDDPRPLPREPADRGQADAAASSDDDGNLAVEASCHLLQPPGDRGARAAGLPARGVSLWR